MKRLAIEIVGWYGTIAILFAYALVSFGVILPTSAAYQILNATGGVGIIIHSLSKRDYQPAVLNAVWMIIAIVALGGLLLN